MLSANVLVIMIGAAMIVVIVMGRANGTSGPTILARCALLAAVGWILALTIFPIPGRDTLVEVPQALQAG